MWVYRVEHTVVTVLGFLLGAALAICIAPGDILLVLMAGVVLGFFARGFLDQNLGGELFWPLARPSGKKHAKSDRTASGGT